MPNVNWSTRPEEIMDAAKDRAKEAIKNNKKPDTLTTLERAYYQSLKHRLLPKP